jgi:hypothetical protein
LDTDTGAAENDIDDDDQLPVEEEMHDEEPEAGESDMDVDDAPSVHPAALPAQPDLPEQPYGLRFRSRLGLSEPLRSQAKDAEMILNCRLDGNQLYYHIKWKGLSLGTSTWEVSNSSLLSQEVKDSFRESLVPSAFYDSLDVEEELEKQPVDPTHDKDVPLELIGRSRQSKGNRVQREFKDCSARSGLDNADRTFGGLYGMCPCGYMAPPWEIIGAESCTIVSNGWV